MKTVIALGIVSSLLTACSTVGGHSIVGPDGTENELVGCAAIEDCYGFARQICGGNYKIVNSSSDTEGSGGKMGTTTTALSLLVKCDSGHATYPNGPGYSADQAPAKAADEDATPRKTPFQ